jgi:DNA-binding MarR family transcriptional regulator
MTDINFFSHSNTLVLSSIIDLFSTIGLTEDHARIYLVATSRTKFTITELSRETGINRSTLHSKLKIMESSGVVTLIEENNKLLIQPSNLTFLTTKISDQVAKAKELLNSAFDINRVYFVTERNLIFDVYNKLLNDLGDSSFYYINGNLSKWYDLNPKFFSRFIKDRDAIIKQQKYNIKAIYDRGYRGNENNLDYETFYRPISNFDYRILEDIDYTSNTVITDKRLIIHSIETNQLIYTSNEFMISAFKLNFEILWKSLR